LLTTFFRTVALGVRSLLLHKLRSFLTMLGILFGVASVVAMLAIGEGASEEAQAKFLELGSTNVIARSVKPSADSESSAGMASRSARGVIYGLTFKDLDVIRGTVAGIDRVVGVRTVLKPTSHGARNVEARLSGTTEDFLEVARVEVDRGRFLSAADNLRRSNVVVIGEEVRRQLFPFEDPIAKNLAIGGENFEVIGTLRSRGGASEKNFEGSDEDKICYIPLATMETRFGFIDVQRSAGSRSTEQVELHEVRVRATSLDAVPDVAQAVRDILKRTHEKDDVQVIVPLELLRTVEEQKRIWKAVLAAIAGISLLVGGIGVMNVMLATVTERTREIGVRRALGAKKRHVISQFLVETLVLSTAGGAIGVFLGIAIPFAVEYYADMKTVVRWDAVGLAFGISALVGVVFGLYPAMRAASMDPVEALRHE
jgi:putative ABC transport system permease protein